MYTAPLTTPERQAFYERIAADNMAPLWEVLGSLVPRKPSTPCKPALWRATIRHGPT